ncbi:haloacid dehalogenase-like hydrolase domain-containing protein Sgpp isoform X2 [Brachypodium distachyon]|uniref:Haloacid dehalogenase-like hydrolase domain-containing protein Sgpp n=1 Tax=Brachypodium distachyon TaxID=15368 RepID=A0A0Q3IC88_BRADI|nr:haloacid dehalogenase-like hydrolase domain-containing protein Sgpp isoform X2 [Brachypodium distachyon]KQJ97875.1 hypothetical protein BRADI_3g33880v3 [Brachypodium distachyon]|eukprot:XP_010235017.1 haloacid dehalogenase-like hydrolase domain-containing protein Sgpp isoform X2 [Brachypodium distachyon]
MRGSHPHVCHPLHYWPVPAHLASRPSLPPFSPRISVSSSGGVRLAHRSVAANMSTAAGDSSSAALTKLAPLEAVLFDIDGTLCDSDPFHFLAFRELLQQVGFNGGVPITEEFYSANISGWHNDALAGALFPDLDHAEAMDFMDRKEALFRKMATGQLKGLDGLQDLCGWIERRGLKRAAVTNAPRENAELVLSLLGLTSFFPVLVIGSECERAKPAPDPYLRALQLIGASPDHTFIFEDSSSGVRAGVAAGVAVVGLTTGNPEKVLMDAGASLVVGDFRDPKLLAILQQLDPAPADN